MRPPRLIETAHSSNYPEDFARYSVRAYDTVNYARSPPDYNSFYQAREATRFPPANYIAIRLR